MRGCDEVKKNDVIGRTGRGYTAGIAFDLNANGQLDVRVVRRVHGVVPDGRADQQARDRDRAGRRGSARCRVDPPAAGLQGRLRHLPRTEQERRREA